MSVTFELQQLYRLCLSFILILLSRHSPEEICTRPTLRKFMRY